MQLHNWKAVRSPSVTLQGTEKRIPFALHYVTGHRKEHSARPPLRSDLTTCTFRHPSTPLRPHYMHIPAPFHFTPTSLPAFQLCNCIAAASMVITVCCNRALLCGLAAPALHYKCNITKVNINKSNITIVNIDNSNIDKGE